MSTSASNNRMCVCSKWDVAVTRFIFSAEAFTLNWPRVVSCMRKVHIKSEVRKWREENKNKEKWSARGLIETITSARDSVYTLSRSLICFLVFSSSPSIKFPRIHRSTNAHTYHRHVHCSSARKVLSALISEQRDSYHFEISKSWSSKMCWLQRIGIVRRNHVQWSTWWMSGATYVIYE